MRRIKKLDIQRQCIAHKSKVSMEYLEKKGLNILSHPTISPALNQIKDVWSELNTCKLSCNINSSNIRSVITYYC